MNRTALYPAVFLLLLAACSPAGNGTQTAAASPVATSRPATVLHLGTPRGQVLSSSAPTDSMGEIWVAKRTDYSLQLDLKPSARPAYDLVVAAAGPIRLQINPSAGKSKNTGFLGLRLSSRVRGGTWAAGKDIPNLYENWHRVDLEINRNSVHLFVDGQDYVDTNFDGEPIDRITIANAVGEEKSRSFYGQVAHIAINGDTVFDSARPASIKYFRPHRGWFLTKPS